jgi:DNA-binding NarL/FixJ family response regulator
MIRILLADEQEVVRDAIAEALRTHAEIEVLAAAATGTQAVELARQLHPDLVVLEISLPELSGIDVATQILESLPGTRILALTTCAFESVVCEAMQAGFSGYVLKKCPFNQFVDAIRAVSSGQMYLCPQVVGAVVGNRNAEGKQARSSSHAISDRERQVLQLVSEGYSTKEIADQLTISLKTVETHRRRVMSKLKIFSVAQLTKYAIREGLTTV